MIDATLAALERSLDFRSQAHAIHTSNVANANVPGYKARAVDFEFRMQEALSALNPEKPMLRRETDAAREIASIQADVYEDPLARPSGDGNTVNIDREQTELAKNTIAYEGAIQLLNKKMAMAKFAITEGAR